MGEVGGVDEIDVVSPPGAARSRQISRSRSSVTARLKSRWLMASFWQNTQSSGQPEKNTVPGPGP